MAFGGFENNRQGAPMADINVTPMVDVMLVLLVIFIITAPLFTHAVKLDLPAAQSAPAPEKPETVTLAINAAGEVFWNDAPVTQSDLPARMAAAAQKKPQPDLQLRADKSTRYEIIAQVMAAAQSNGLTRLGFVTEPTAAATPAPGR
jgi:biopolymer transport protein ExbD